MANPHPEKALLADSHGNAMISDQQTNLADLAAVAITDADASLGATTQAEIEGYFNDLVTRINALNAVLVAHGLEADA